MHVGHDVHPDRALPGRRRARRATTSPIGKGHVAATTPVTYGIVGFTVGYQRGTAVSPTYDPPFAIDHRVLRRVVVEPDGLEYRDPPAEEQAAVAMQ